jgi:hypothetical protein
MNFIDISGVGNAGKSAVVDLLRELDNFYVPEYWFEFDMMRVPGGLLDFRHCLLEDWSPIRSHAAYHEFLDVTSKMGRDPAPWNIPGLINSTGQRYDRRFDGQFRCLSRQFADQFRVGSYQTEWPYDGLRENGIKRLAKRLIRRLGVRRSLFNDVLLLNGYDFDNRAKVYLENLYRLFISPTCDHVVFNNGFEPFNPEPGLRMLGARQIAVTRDPRDIYVSGLSSHNINDGDKHLLAFDNDGLSKSFLATDDLDAFVRRYRLYQEKLFNGSRKDVLHVKFEELILDSHTQIKLILEFLDIDSTRHVRPNSFFIPTESKKNIGLWRDYSRKDEIRFIESQLCEYLVD